MRHLHSPYDAVMAMPTYERRFFIEMLKNEINAQKDRMQESQDNIKGGKGRRSKRISGEAVKQYSGKI